MAKSAKTDFVSFPPIACQYIRNLCARRAVESKRRKDLFKTRDVLRAEIYRLEKGSQTAKAEQKKTECYDVEEQIRQLGISINWLADEFERAVENADQEKLFESPEVEVPSDLLVPKAPKDDAGDDEGDDEEQDDPGQAPLPVGEPGTPAPVNAGKRGRVRPRKGGPQ